MKKIIALISGVTLLALAGSAFAKEDLCPDVYYIRSVGSNISKAYLSKSGDWVLSSEPFEFNGAIWQTHFQEVMSGVSDPSTAIAIAQNDLNSFSLMTTPEMNQYDTITMCDYAPTNAVYHLTALNYVAVGFKKA